MSRFWGLHAGLAMVLGGSIGNAYDRLFARVWLPGELEPRIREVRDFVEVDLYFMTWPVFNVADALLVVGVGHALGPWAVPDHAFSAMVFVSAVTTIGAPLVMQRLLRGEDAKDSPGEDSVAAG